MANTINQFFKENREERENEFYAATKRFKDEKGETLLWELRPLSTKHIQSLRAKAVDRSGQIDMQKFTNSAIVAAVVDPNLHDENLQNSYGVKKAEDLLLELVYPAELDLLQAKVLGMNGYGDNLEELIKQAKN